MQRDTRLVLADMEIRFLRKGHVAQGREARRLEGLYVGEG